MRTWGTRDGGRGTGERSHTPIAFPPSLRHNCRESPKKQPEHLTSCREPSSAPLPCHPEQQAANGESPTSALPFLLRRRSACPEPVEGSRSHSHPHLSTGVPSVPPSLCMQARLCLRPVLSLTKRLRFHPSTSTPFASSCHCERTHFFPCSSPEKQGRLCFRNKSHVPPLWTIDYRLWTTLPLPQSLVALRISSKVSLLRRP